MVDINKDVIMVVVAATLTEAEVGIVMITEAGRVMEEEPDMAMVAREDAITIAKAKDKVVTCEIATIINYNYNDSIELRLPTNRTPYITRTIFYYIILVIIIGLIGYILMTYEKTLNFLFIHYKFEVE